MRTVLRALHVKDEETETRGDVSKAAMPFVGPRYFQLPGHCFPININIHVHIHVYIIVLYNCTGIKANTLIS